MTAWEEALQQLRREVSQKELDAAWKRHKCAQKLDISQVRLTNGEFAPEFVVQCAVVPYLDQYVPGSDYLGVYKIVKTADKAAAMLMLSSLYNALKQAWEWEDTAHVFLIPYCRYAPERNMVDLMKKMKEWNNFKRYGRNGRTRIATVSGALLLSDTRTALLYCDGEKRLDRYAAIRGTDAQVLRDTVLCQVGLDENGQRVFNLETKTVTAALNQNLELTLFDNAAGKPVKTLPKKDTDPTAVAIAQSELTVLKKQIKEATANRRERLFAEFLEEMPRPVESWLRSYTANPLLRAMARLVVWKQGSDTFLPDEAGNPILSTGETYTLTGDPISVAHPREMDPADVTRWQTYFRSHGLRQLFEQIWEPVYPLEAISPDRYRDCIFQGFHFMTFAQHGISIVTEDFHEKGRSIVVRLKDCTWERREGPIWAQDLRWESCFTMGAFRVDKPSRASNHIVFMLDKWTLRQRIARDDVSAVAMLDYMTAAQVAEALNLALENQATACTAALLELKNNKFPEDTQEMEFLL